MTYIIGGKCKDGVVIIADKKIIDPETSLVEVKDKLFIFRKDNFYYPIVIGSSGTVPLYDKFKKDAIAKLEKIKPNKISFTFKSFTTSFNVSGMIYPYVSMSDNAM